MSDPREREEQIFAEALALPPEERARYLDQATAGDRDLRARIEALLAAHDSAGDFMLAPPPDVPPPPVAAVPPVSEAPGTRIGRYKLQQKLGEGGCGVVWMAEQELPVRRRVALKIIKLGMDTKAVIARFEAERQALAMMDHPNIAKVFDAGATSTGRPYFVMELVRGIPITKYCDENSLATKQRLELFTQVCLAVQHAHQKGIIHRDLKPSNVLVTMHDGVPVPKVIDFGIAKATQGRLTDQTLFTAFEQFIGTPAYMSPEQAELSGLDVDTRSDIYSLGVLLYELLTGRPPFDPAELRQAGLDEIRRVLREVDPPKPSTNLSTQTQSDRQTIAKLRGTDPQRLSLLLRGDLDWIVMKAMEKNRTRRYDTPTDLAADIVRHLNDEPVKARPPSRAYQFAKLVRRNRLLVGAIAAVLFALIAGTIISTWQAIRATRAERVATEERIRAQAERARAEDLLSFMLGDLRGQLSKVGRLELLEGVGDRAMAYFASRKASDLDDQTLARHARALTQIGEIRMSQARYTEAAATFAEAYDRAAALATRHPQDGDMLFERAQAEFWNGNVHWKRGELRPALEWLQRYHDSTQELHARDPQRADWRLEAAYGQHNLAVLLMDANRLDEARTDFLAELKTREEIRAANPADMELNRMVADTHSWLGTIAERQGDYQEALAQYGEDARLLREAVEKEPNTLRWKFFLANNRLMMTDVAVETGRLDDASRTVKEGHGLFQVLTEDDPTNRLWQTSLITTRMKEVEIALARRDFGPAAQALGELRPQLEKFVAKEPNDRIFVSRLGSVWRLEAQLRAATERPDAAVAIARAVELSESLVREGRADEDDLGQCARANVLAGEIAAQTGDAAEARRRWQHALDVLAPRLEQSHNWRILDPAVRASLRLGRAEDARKYQDRLNSAGFVPMIPWPASAPTGG